MSQPAAARPLHPDLHTLWDAVAPGWDHHAPFVEARGATVSERLLELAAPAPGDRVLELACGIGGPGFQAAARVRPGGEVVVSDVAPAMVRAAARRAPAGVVTRVLDLEAIDEPDASFDVVLCREGLMLVADPASAAAEIRRVLRPGGRVAVSVWGERARNPWLGLVFDVVSEQLGVAVPPPGLPHPFSLEDAGRLAEVLVGAGLAGVEVSELEVPYRAASVDEWWQRTAQLAGPLAQRLAALPAEAVNALHWRAAAAAAPYTTAEGLELPGVCLVAAARR